MNEGGVLTSAESGLRNALGGQGMPPGVIPLGMPLLGMPLLGMTEEELASRVPSLAGTPAFRDLLAHAKRVHDLPRYFRRFNGSEVAEHVRLLARVSPEQPAVAVIHPRPDSSDLDLVIVGRDGYGVAAAVLRNLTEMGFFIRDIRVATYDLTRAPGVEARYVLALQVAGNPIAQADLGAREKMLHERLRAAFAPDLAPNQGNDDPAERVRRVCDEACSLGEQFEEQGQLLSRLADLARRNEMDKVKSLLLSADLEPSRAGAGSFWGSRAVTAAVSAGVVFLAVELGGGTPRTLADSVPSSGSVPQPARTAPEALPAVLSGVLASTLGSGSCPSQGDQPPLQDRGERLAGQVRRRIHAQAKKPLAVQLRELIQVCDGNPDSPSVAEFVSNHGDDPSFRLQAASILGAYRRERASRARAERQEVGGVRFLGSWLWHSVRDAFGWSAKPLPVQLRELIQRCERNPDAQPVLEFLAQHEGDATLAQQAPSIRGAFRRERERAARSQQQG